MSHSYLLGSFPPNQVPLLHEWPEPLALAARHPGALRRSALLDLPHRGSVLWPRRAVEEDLGTAHCRRGAEGAEEKGTEGGL